MHCFTWYMQFPRCMTDGFTRASLELSANIFDFSSETLRRLHPDFTYPPRRYKRVRPGLVSVAGVQPYTRR
jgi:hypothetical protein